MASGNSIKSVIPFLFQGPEKGAQETPGSRREAAVGSSFWSHKALLMILYILKGGDYTLNISAMAGNGKSETTISKRSQFSIMEM